MVGLQRASIAHCRQGANTHTQAHTRAHTHTAGLAALHSIGHHLSSGCTISSLTLYLLSDSILALPFSFPRLHNENSFLFFSVIHRWARILFCVIAEDKLLMPMLSFRIDLALWLSFITYPPPFYFSRFLLISFFFLIPPCLCVFILYPG